MAKVIWIIACVCYCTVCAQLAIAEMLKKELDHRKSHVIDSANFQIEDNVDIEWGEQQDHGKPYSIHENSNLNVMDEHVTQYFNKKSNYNSKNLELSVENTINDRSKRHAAGDHSHGSNTDSHSFTEINPNTQLFIKKLFERFGDSKHETMNVFEFEQMVKHLGLDRLIEEQHHGDVSDDSNSGSRIAATSSHDTHADDQSCISSISLLSKVSATQSAVNQENIKNFDKLINEIENQSKITNKLNSKLTDVADIKASNETIKSIKENISLDKNDLWSLCPILLYQLAAPSSLERNGCISSKLLSSSRNQHHDNLAETNRTWVWIYASLSIIIASLCGLLGVAVIPCMEKRYYQHVLQFFVALAIGTLTGDALLHLMPHAMMTFSSIEVAHTSMTYKGLVAALAIIFFFLTERLLTMVAEWRKKIHKRDDPAARVRVMRDPDSVSVNHSLNGEKQCKHKYSSYPYCYDEIALDTKDNHHQHHQHHQRGTGHSHGKENGLKTALTSASPPKEKLCAKTLNDRANDYSDTAQSLLTTRNHNSIGVTDAYYRSNEKEDVQTPDNNTILTNLDDSTLDTCGCDNKKTQENYTIILREHESKHHGHSHTHGHVHSPPKTLSAVAWMVVMGDGLHNFTDGMAIGAAFSNNIAGGFSTAIAVFCHELPHELGDFAVLLKAGMSAKKAVYYNILSSVLSFLGMVLGVLVGDTPEASAWIFACAAGMFIYIALVDMMPELTTAHNEHSAFTQCFLQFTGMVIGVTIMLLIALFENDLKDMFTADGHPHHHSH